MSPTAVLALIGLILAIIAAVPGARNYPVLHAAVVFVALAVFIASGAIKF